MHTPTIFDVRSTDRCNAKCWFCSGKKKVEQFPSPDMTPEVVEQVLDYFPSVEQAWMAGYGETLLGHNVAAIARMLVAYDKRVTLITNGTRIVAMKEEMPWDLITTRISLNEVHSSNYRLTSGVDKLEKVIAGFEWLHDRGAHVQLKFLIAKHNIHRVPDYLIFAMKYPGVELVFGPMSDYTDGKNPKEWERHALFDDDYDAKELMAQHRKLAQSRGVKVLSWPRFIQREGTPVGGCVWPWQHITVDGAGNVGACCRMIAVDGAVQNIHEVGPAAWYAPGLEKLREAVGRGGAAMPEACRYCIVR